MKIIVATRDLDFGVGNQVRYLLSMLDEDEFVKKVFVIAPRKLEGYSNKIIFEIVENKGKFFVTKVPYFAYKCNSIIKRTLKSEHYDLIHTHYPIKFYGINIPIVFTVHSSHLEMSMKKTKSYIYNLANVFHRLFIGYEEDLMDSSRKVIFVNQNLMKKIILNNQNLQTKSIYLPNMVDTKKFKILKKDEKIIIKKSLGFKENDKIILYVGRLDPFKGSLVLANTIKKINNPQLKLMVIGDGHLIKKIIQFPFVRYQGIISNEELYKYYNIADLFVLPSYYETFGLVAIESILCGCNFLLRENFLPLEIEEKNLFISDENLENSINKTIKINPPKNKELIKQIKKEFDAPLVYSKIRKVYEEIKNAGNQD